MDEAKREKINRFMLEEYARFAPMLHRYDWPWETARWHELVFCLMAAVDDSAMAEAIARETTEIFADLDLLEVDDLADLLPKKGELDYGAQQPALMLGILERQGYDAEEARTAVTTICQAASALKQEFGGKVQRYLRQYGEQMVQEVQEHFSFDRMDEEDTSYAFTHWLQNVLNMPIPLSHPSVKRLSRKLGIEVEELVDFADRNDVNLALVDDWAADYMEREAETET
jgi:hypothetical protein